MLTLLETIPLTDWGNLSALGCLISLVLWFAMRGLPDILTRFDASLEASRRDFKEVVSSLVQSGEQARADYREESAAQREALNQLTQEIRTQETRSREGARDAGLHTR